MFESVVNWHVYTELHDQAHDLLGYHMRTQPSRDTAVTVHGAVCPQAETLLLGTQNQILNQIQTQIGEISAV